MLANRRLIYFVTIILISLVAFETRSTRGASLPAAAAIVEQNSAGDTGWLAAPAAFSCAAPTPDTKATCRDLERQILASTVRIEWHITVERVRDGRPGRFREGLGYGTIMDGRYVVTHNHYGQALEGLVDPQNAGRTRLALYKANGEPLFVWRAPITAFTTVAVGEETLVFDFGQSRLFDIWKVPSAEFANWESMPLKSGMEVARVNWDGERAYVEWVLIEELLTEDGTPRLQVGGPIKLGASGGGVFWDGVHIGNNWSVVTHRDRNRGEITRQYSKVALNSSEVVALPTDE